MPLNSSRKGKVYENKIAKVLSEWCGFKLIRTPMSGAWQGTAGDIKPKNNTESFPFTIECKNTESWNFHQIFKGRGEFYTWVDQAVREAKEDREIASEQRIPILIFSTNFAPNYVSFPFFNYILYNYGFKQLSLIDIGGDLWFVSTLDQLVSSISYTEFAQAITTHIGTYG